MNRDDFSIFELQSGGMICLRENDIGFFYENAEDGLCVASLNKTDSGQRIDKIKGTISDTFGFCFKPEASNNDVIVDFCDQCHGSFRKGSLLPTSLSMGLAMFLCLRCRTYFMSDREKQKDRDG